MLREARYNLMARLTEEQNIFESKQHTSHINTFPIRNLYLSNT
jgi:hypothetical protein